VTDDDIRPLIPPSVAALDLQTLIGLSEEEARLVVEGAGGHLRAIPRGGAVTADYRGDRVTVVIGIVEVLGIG
jgi:hypothetical protein